VASAPAAVLTSPVDQRVTVATLHLAALGLAAVLLYRAASGLVVDWLPLVAIPFLYAELPHIALAGLHDSMVQRWEFAMFGASPAQTLATRWPSPYISEPLHAAYIAYYAIIYLPPMFLYLRRGRSQFDNTVAGLMTVFAVCYAAFIVFPVAGPRYEWPAPPGVFDGPVRRFVLHVLAAGSSRGTAFPSSHVAVATVQSIIAFRWSSRAAVVLSVLTAGLAVGAVYGGFHYAIDVLAGATLGLVIGITLVFAHKRTGP
jgi:membrane-associated phospholipid phosphatase